uniref:Uncharacterized protein n=1 Tax=Amorphochlora amoebiformis TaxID=1561963 RepID=A0A0H5BIA6_9EUKA|nr:hypothetical protein [Amorphochlora amoebiformis]
MCMIVENIQSFSLSNMSKKRIIHLWSIIKKILINNGINSSLYMSFNTVILKNTSKCKNPLNLILAKNFIYLINNNIPIRIVLHQYQAKLIFSDKMTFIDLSSYLFISLRQLNFLQQISIFFNCYMTSNLKNTIIIGKKDIIEKICQFLN